MDLQINNPRPVVDSLLVVDVPQVKDVPRVVETFLGDKPLPSHTTRRACAAPRGTRASRGSRRTPHLKIVRCDSATKRATRRKATKFTDMEPLDLMKPAWRDLCPGGLSPTRARGDLLSCAFWGGSPVRCHADLVPADLHPEAIYAVCSVCGRDDATDENDLALCDRCDRGFHQDCHNPRVSSFGNHGDMWFCTRCTHEMAEERCLRRRSGDLVWVTRCGRLPWPARVLRIDFASLTDPKPYWAQFFTMGPPKGEWVGDSQLLGWSEGPSRNEVRDPRRRAALKLAETTLGAVSPDPRTAKLQKQARGL